MSLSHLSAEKYMAISGRDINSVRSFIFSFLFNLKVTQRLPLPRGPTILWEEVQGASPTVGLLFPMEVN